MLMRKFSLTSVVSQMTTPISKAGVFVDSFNPMTGKKEWKMQPSDYDYHQEVARAAFADMLHDSERNHLYYLGLKAAIHHKRELGEEVHVLDIGTGTGLLSMMAAKIGVDTITACEEFGPVANIASRVINSNGFSDKIKLVRKRSTELQVGPGKDMERRANILVTEVFDTELIGEGAIGTFNHAHQNLLTDDCLVVPCEATLYAQVVESDLASRWNSLHPIKTPKGNLIPPDDEEAGSSSALSLHDVQLTQMKKEWFQPITPPLSVFKFDFTGKKGGIPLNEQTVTTVQALEDGSCDAVFIWWDIYMDPSKRVLLSCAPIWAHPTPDKIAWRDHWMQAIFYPYKKVQVKKDESLTVVSHHNEYSFMFDVSKKDPKTISPLPSSIPYGGIHQAGISRTRLGQLNDSVRNEKFISVLSSTFEKCKNAVVLCLSDLSLLPLMAIACGAGKVYVAESNTFMRKILNAYIRHNCQILQEEKLIFLEKDFASILPEDIPEKIDVVLGEPHFQMCYLPWHHLFYWYCLHQSVQKIDESIEILPKKVEIWAIPVEYKDLWKIRSPLIEVEGFKMKHFDDVIMSACEVSDANVEPHPLWEYPCLARASSATKLMTFDLRKYKPEDAQKTINVIKTEGVVNGMAIWVDWFLNDDIIDSSGPTIPIKSIGQQIEWNVHCRQGVYLFKERVTLDSIECITSFNPGEGDIEFSFK